MSLEVFAPTLSWEVPPVAGVFEVNGPPSLDLNFLSGTLDNRITFTRASSATSGLYTDAAGSSYTSFATGVARIDTVNGLLIEEQRTNSLKNSDTPATQTTASLAAGTYTLWVIGTGSATSSAGTATGTGFGAATAGTPNTFTLTVGGTVTVTKSGTLTRFQLELGAFPTSYIPTTASTATRAKDLASMLTGSWFNSAGPGALTAEGLYSYGPVNPNNAYLAQIADASGANAAQLRRNGASSNVAALVVVSSAQKINTVTGVLTPGSVVKSGVTWGAMGTLTAYNGTSGPRAALAALLGSAPTVLNIGNNVGINFQTNGFVRRIRYWPRFMNTGELQEATA